MTTSGTRTSVADAHRQALQTRMSLGCARTTAALRSTECAPPSRSSTSDRDGLPSDRYPWRDTGRPRRKRPRRTALGRFSRWTGQEVHRSKCRGISASHRSSIPIQSTDARTPHSVFPRNARPPATCARPRSRGRRRGEAAPWPTPVLAASMEAGVAVHSVGNAVDLKRTPWNPQILTCP